MLKRCLLSLGMLSALATASAAVIVQGASAIGGSAASASELSSIDCSQSFGGDYLASVTGSTATVTLNTDCNSTPYYLVVYTASGNQVQAINLDPTGNLLPPGCPTYSTTSTAATINPTDPNSYCSFPSSGDFPEYLVQTVQFTGSSLTVPLPSSCWQLDVVNAPLNIPSELTQVAGGLGNFVWGENGPTNSACTPPTTSTSAPLTIGYWKNHTSAMAPLLPQALGNYAVTTTAEGVAVLSDPSAKYAENQLAAQLLAAELNLANNAPTCPALATAITDANGLLATIGYDGPPSSVIGSSSPYRTQAINDATTLAEYNQGTLC
jgi:hypothetical protein